MLNFTETAACEWAASGVRVNAVAPGYIASSDLDNYPPEFAEQSRHIVRKVPLQRWGNEAEVSAAIVFLLGDAAAYITGSLIRVDGGVPNARPTWPLPAHERSKPFAGFPLYRVPMALNGNGSTQLRSVDPAIGGVNWQGESLGTFAAQKFT